MIELSLTELAAWSDLQAVIVPFRHDRQLQFQRGYFHIPHILIAVQLDYRHFRVKRCGGGRGRGSGYFRPGRRWLAGRLCVDHRLDVCQQALGFLPGLYVLLTVMEEKEQCRKDQHCSHC